MNQTLHLDEAEACSESAALSRPLEAACITAWVGGGERPEFIRQAELLSLMWRGLEARTRCVIDGNFNHFTVIEGLTDSNSAICKAFLTGEQQYS